MKAVERRAHALAMRRSGKIFREIGVALGVSASRAGQLVSRALRDEAYVPPPPPRPAPDIAAATKLSELPISVRADNVLINCGFQTVSDLLRSDREEFKREMLRVPNCNRRAWQEIEHVLDQVKPG